MEMIQVERLGLKVDFAQEAYEDYSTKTEEEKDKMFLNLIEMFNRSAKPIPTRYKVGGKTFNSEDEALKYKESIKELIEEANRIIKIFNNSCPSDIPCDQMKVLEDTARKRLPIWGDLGVFSSMYLLGYVNGVRAERKRTTKN